jgi:hypothetical protein
MGEFEPYEQKEFGEPIVVIKHVSKGALIFFHNSLFLILKLEYSIEGREDKVRALTDINLSADSPFPTIRR